MNGNFKNKTAAALTAMIAGFAILGAASAANAAMFDTSSPAASIHSWNGQSFAIYNMDELKKQERLGVLSQATPQGVASLQTALRGNSALKQKLEAQDVQLNNVIGAQQAADGSLIIYTR